MDGRTYICTDGQTSKPTLLGQLRGVNQKNILNAEFKRISTCMHPHIIKADAILEHRQRQRANEVSASLTLGTVTSSKMLRVQH